MAANLRQSAIGAGTPVSVTIKDPNEFRAMGIGALWFLAHLQSDSAVLS